MGPWILTVVCLSGLLAGAQMAWNWRHLSRRTDFEPLPRGWAGARRAIRSIAVTVNSGIIAGALVGGLGGRLFMRIMAATSADSAQGLLTAADKTVGEITVAGSMEIVVFGGVFGGILAALVHRIFRRWLPKRGWLAGIVSAAVTLGIFGRLADLLNRHNKDFTILSPRALAVALIVILVVSFGAVLGAVYERLDRGMPKIGWSVGALAFAPLLLISAAGTPAAVMMVVTGAAAIASNSLNQWIASETVTEVGRYVTIAVVAIAAVSTVAEAAAILV